MIRDFIKYNPFVSRTRQYLDYARWRVLPAVGPSPHLYKQRTIRQYAAEFKLGTLVETGTYMGDMVFAMKKFFERIHSVELSPELYERAVARFSADPQVSLWKGDSAALLSDIIGQLHAPTLFWLDGHYSGGATARAEIDTPVVAEVRAIIEQCNVPFVILIDDARLFVGEGGYPHIDWLRETLHMARPDLSVHVFGDIIRITPHGL